MPESFLAPLRRPSWYTEVPTRRTLACGLSFLTTMRINYSSPRKWVVSSIVVVGLLCVAGAIAGLYVLAPALHRIARTRTEEYLRERFKSSVQFTDFHVSVYPRIHLIIDGLVMRHEGRTDILPLIQISTITIDANLASFLAARPVISHVTLDGLHINTPPH